MSDGIREITFVRWDGSKVQINFTKSQADGNKVEIEGRYPQKPKASFVEALQGLAVHVTGMIDTPEEYAEDLEVRRIKIGSKSGYMTAEIHALKRLSFNNKPLNIHVPVYVEGSKEDGSVGIMTEDCADQLRAVIAEASAYLDGNRQEDDQQALPGMGEEPESNPLDDDGWEGLDEQE